MAKKGLIYSNIDTSSFDKMIGELQHGSEGRKLIRRASKECLNIFENEARKNSGNLQLKREAKNWRKIIKKKGVYKTKMIVSNRKFHVSSGVNYSKHPILNITHLIERGFRHVASGKFIRGFFPRERAYDNKASEVKKKFTEYLRAGIHRIAETGKAPTAKEMRNL